MNEKIFELARELGEAIKQSEAFLGMKKAEEEANNSDALVKLSGEFENVRYCMQEESMKDEPDHQLMSDLTKRMSEIKQSMLENASMKQLQTSREAFSALMNEVNRQLQGVLNPESLEEHSCSGSCHSCSGCH